MKEFKLCDQSGYIYNIITYSGKKNADARLWKFSLQHCDVTYVFLSKLNKAR